MGNWIRVSQVSSKVFIEEVQQQLSTGISAFLSTWKERAVLLGLFKNYYKTLKLVSPVSTNSKRQQPFLLLSTFSVSCPMWFTRGPAYVIPPDRLQMRRPQALGMEAPSQFHMRKCQLSSQWASPGIRGWNYSLKLILESLNLLLTLVGVKGFLLNWFYRHFIKSFDQFKKYVLHYTIPTLVEKLPSKDWQRKLTPCHKTCHQLKTYCCWDLLAVGIV